MTRIIMYGCNGKMGRVISSLVKEDAAAEIVAGIDISGEQLDSYPVYKSLAECPVEADALIDFSAPAALTDILTEAKKRRLPLVLCTTGYSEEQLTEIKKASTELAILRSANMSLGVNLLMKLVQAATQVLAAADFDIEIIEKHHNQKVDAPSGTALAFADAINEVLHNEYAYQYDRSQKREKRAKKEIGISAVRGGTIVGEHEILFAGADEVVELKHTAYSKAIFGKGAVSAAKFLNGRSAGMYDMKDVIAL
ncbi:MAG: 4-hydroxy-tetrahydrodipicolinate reductase [Lachnospiraceae bacterium]